jgi:hypothetical protein
MDDSDMYSDLDNDCDLHGVLLCTETEDSKPLPSYATLYQHQQQQQQHNSSVLAALSSPPQPSHHHATLHPLPHATPTLQSISNLSPLARQQMMSSLTSHSLASNAVGVDRGLSLDSMLMKQATEPPFAPSPPKAIPVPSEYDAEQRETEAAVHSLDNQELMPLKPASVSQT